MDVKNFYSNLLAEANVLDTNPQVYISALTLRAIMKLTDIIENQKETPNELPIRSASKKSV